MDIDLTKYVIGDKRERKLNRFSCSELYYLLNGYTNIKDYVSGKDLTPQEAWRMKLGTLKHQYLEEYLKSLGYQTEVKKEFKYGDIELVGIADALNLDYGIEIKTSDKVKTQSSRSHEYQARLYCSLFDVPVFHIMQPIIDGNKAVLKEIGKVKKNDKWWQEQLERINEFYKIILKDYVK
jgi:hypothetical protein